MIYWWSNGGCAHLSNVLRCIRSTENVDSSIQLSLKCIPATENLKTLNIGSLECARVVSLHFTTCVHNAWFLILFPKNLNLLPPSFLPILGWNYLLGQDSSSFLLLFSFVWHNAPWIMFKFSKSKFSCGLIGTLFFHAVRVPLPTGQVLWFWTLVSHNSITCNISALTTHTHAIDVAPHTLRNFPMPVGKSEAFQIHVGWCTHTVAMIPLVLRVYLWHLL